MIHFNRKARRGAWIAAFVLAGSLSLTGLPAQARLSDPGYGGGLSDGFFKGLPVRAQRPAGRETEPEKSGIAGASCYTLRQTVQDRLGGTVLRTVRICD